jgi:CTP:molybdopterin cytidylyltransferase MocA
MAGGSTRTLSRFPSGPVAIPDGVALGLCEITLVRPDTVGALVDAAAPTAVPVYLGKRGHPVALTREVAERLATGALLTGVAGGMLGSAALVGALLFG